MTEEEFTSIANSHRALLKMVARNCLPPWLYGKLSDSDLVQMTLAEGWNRRDECLGQTTPEFVAWLRGIMGNKALNIIRSYQTQMRDAQLEESLSQARDSSERLEELLADGDSGPEQQAIRNEELCRLAVVLEKLPGKQRPVYEMYHIQGLTITRIMSELTLSEGQVSGLLYRANRTVSEQMTAKEQAP
jgi:RNA polymerase sigma-70 factor, ECF subfamily